MHRPTCECGNNGQWHRWPNGRSEFMCPDCWKGHLKVIANRNNHPYGNAEALAMTPNERKRIFQSTMQSADAAALLNQIEAQRCDKCNKILTFNKNAEACRISAAAGLCLDCNIELALLLCPNQ